jgi:hypothetical protein
VGGPCVPEQGIQGDLLILREVIHSSVVCVQAVALMQDNHKLDPLFRETAEQHDTVQKNLTVVVVTFCYFVNMKM